MRIPDPGPLGETFFDAKVRAMVFASLVKSPGGGYVDSVFTQATQRLGLGFCSRGILEVHSPGEIHRSVATHGDSG